MKSWILKDYINMNYPTIVTINQYGGTIIDGYDKTKFNSNDLSSYTGRIAINRPVRIAAGVNPAEQINIEIQLDLSASESINCAVLQGFWDKSFNTWPNYQDPQVAININGYNRNSAGVKTLVWGPRTLRYSQGKWVFFDTNTTLAGCNTFVITITATNLSFGADTTSDYTSCQIEKVFLGKAVEVPLEILEGYQDETESHDKREITTGQYTNGSYNSTLKTYYVTLRPVLGAGIDAEKTALKSVLKFMKDMKSCWDFIFFTDPTNPDWYCDRVTITDEQTDVEYTEADQNNITFNLKEVR